MTLDDLERDHRRARGRPKGTTRAVMLQRMCENSRSQGLLVSREPGHSARAANKAGKRLPRVETAVSADPGLVVSIYVHPYRLREHLRARRRRPRLHTVSLKIKVGSLHAHARSQLPPPLSPVHSSSSESESDSGEENTLNYTRKKYRGVLRGPDADTAETTPSSNDMELMEEAKRGLTKPSDSQTEPHVLKQVSQIRRIHIARTEIDTWYTAPYPEEFSRNSVLPVCEFCLKYMSSDFVAWRHSLKCPFLFPPGNEIYRFGRNSVFEVDGRKTPLFCQNLCLLAKMFLDSKALYYDVEPFMFYVLTENDDRGCHFVGYFSKEKQPSGKPYNVSCILTLPTAQRRGYGTFLIEFSYLLTRAQGKVGTPERPLSELGLASYTNYWRWRVCRELRRLADESVSLVSIEHISQATAMTADDVVLTLELLGFLVVDEFGVLLDAATNVIDSVLAQHEKKPRLHVHPECLLWVSPLEGS